MSSATRSVKNKEELDKLMESLALDVVVKGAKALTTKSLGKVVEAGKQAGCPELADYAAGVVARLASAPLSDEEARGEVTRMQGLAGGEAAAPAEVKKDVQETAAFTMLFKDDPEIVMDFVMESSEHLTEIDEKILQLEKDPALIDLLHAVFRGFHSIKGLAGFLELREIQAVAHEVETLLDHARNLRVSITPEFVDLVLETSEYLKEEIALIQAHLSDAELPVVRDNAPLLHQLSLANAAVDMSGSASNAEELKALDAFLAARTASEAAPELAGKALVSAAEQPVAEAVKVVAAAAVAAQPAVAVPVVAAPVVAAPVVAAPVVAAPVVAAPVALQKPATEDEPAMTTALVSQRPAAEAAPTPTVRQSNRGADAVGSSIRVETSKLDRLMDMVGEMVIAQSILSNIPRGGGQADARAAGEMSQLARITAEVQRCAMSMRMMPIGPLFQKNAKMVRDLSRRNGKQVLLELSGESTELDKTIAEELADPLLHMIRNALDHGIETPDERLASGKAPVASLRIAAEHEAGQIVISISDDGRGLDTKRIFKKAVENGLVEANAQLTQDEIFHLIFAPGFSTAEKITDISGRGVGMDVVRQHVQTLRGRIEIESELGKGTTFFIYLPLTLAIIEGLVIVVGAHRYIVPLFSVREMFRPTPEMLFSVQGKDEMILMRGNLLPVIRLHRRFAIEPRTEDICQGLLVVCEFAGKFFCLFVDDLLGRQEVVVKSLDEAFKDVKGLTGSAILGDGRIGLILDVAGIFQAAQGMKESIAA